MTNAPDLDPVLKRPLEMAGVVASVCAAAFLDDDDEAEEKVVVIKFSFSLLAEDDADFLTTPHRQRCVDELRVDSVRLRSSMRFLSNPHARKVHWHSTVTVHIDTMTAHATSAMHSIDDAHEVVGIRGG